MLRGTAFVIVCSVLQPVHKHLDHQLMLRESFSASREGG